MNVTTKHGEIETPNFFPIIGWPAGRGEYDRLFLSLEYFQDKISHKHFLFNFSSFAFGFKIPASEFDKSFMSYVKKDLRKSLVKKTGISKKAADSLIILLDVGGNRIFNKIVLDNKDVSNRESYKPYIDVYFDFVKEANVDIYVSFDIGPSYSTRDEISKKGVRIWNELPPAAKLELNRELLDDSIKRKVDGSLIMVPVNGSNIASFEQHLKEVFSKHQKSVDYLAVGGIANKGVKETELVLKTLRETLDKFQWKVKVHGLGLGGWRNIPLLIKYNIDSCDVATPWRRACTDAVSKAYIPLFDSELGVTQYEDAFKCYEIYDEIWDNVECGCPFCKDVPIKKIRELYKKADKDKSGKTRHGNEYYEMRVRVFYHNVFQHIAFLKKLHIYKTKFGDRFLSKFCESVKSKRIKRYFDAYSNVL
ncbi:MAG: hypothetical protein U0R44_01640 [Candidatus Micrarchaeia archaeon]